LAMGGDRKRKAREARRSHIVTPGARGSLDQE
jgi:hypothetical protein